MPDTLERFSRMELATDPPATGKNAHPTDACSPHDRPRSARGTDWDRYYQRPARTAVITRRITAAALLRQLERFSPPRPAITELGGANSCFLDLLTARLHPREYHVLDTNCLGLELLRQRKGRPDCVRLHNLNVLDLTPSVTVDVAFSIGLIEHFGPQDTARAVRAHFRLLRPGGIAIIGFPTPTPLYRIARWFSERAGAWIFHDERPLKLGEVASAAQECGQLLYEKVLWPLVFTQYLTVWRKR
jgi:hypothetical protein